MINLQDEIKFSENHSQKRISNAIELIGEKKIKHLLGTALFLLGGKREDISNALEIPKGTFFSLLTRFHKIGINAFTDQRVNQPNEEIKENNQGTKSFEIIFGEQKKIINIQNENNKIIINSSNPLQLKVIILSFINSGLTVKEAASILNLSERHIRNLENKLQNEDITGLLDKRQGQQKDYVFTEEIKTELIQQYNLNIVTGRSTTSCDIAKQVNEIFNTKISERTFREHIVKLGLNKIKYSLPKLLEESKKNSKI